MNSLIFLPVNFFDRSLSVEELEKELSQYLKIQSNNDRYISDEEFDINITIEMRNLEEAEKFYIPTIMIYEYRERIINIIDLIVYVYLCFMVNSTNRREVKPVMKNLSRTINERKTDAEDSLNYLVTLGKVIPNRKKSGYYFINE